MIKGILSNEILKVALLSWAIAQTLKVITSLIQDKKFDFSLLISAGGMPSSHTAFITALTVGIGQVVGYDTPIFALSLGFAFIVMYDATGVRWEAGRQAAVINRIIDTLNDPSAKLDTQLKEILGHTPLQVALGALLGILIGTIFF